MNYKSTSVIALIFFIFSFNNSTAQQNECFAIGDEYQGGIIFYIDQTGEHGLIAARTDIETRAESWGGYMNLNPVAQNPEIGFGAQNTFAIIANCNDPNTGAKLCDELDLNGYSDWYLPSINELELIFLHRSVIGNFISTEYAMYMSSTEFEMESDAYWRCYFYDFSDVPAFKGNRKLLTQKDNSGLVRAIRSF